MDIGSSSGTAGINCRSSVKRSLDNMAEPHHTGSPSPLFARNLLDPHYNNEHFAQRPRLGLALPQSRQHYPGDGLDFRRPVMSVNGRAGNSDGAEVGDAVAETIDLTDETNEIRSLRTATAAQSTVPTAGPSRIQGLPRYDRDIIDVASSDEEGPEAPTPQSNSFNARSPPTPQPNRRRRMLRHSSIERSQAGDVEVTGSRSISNPQTRNPTPTTRARNSATPFALEGGVIDLTEENDDDVVLVDSRALPGINAHQPILTAGVGTRVEEGAPPPGQGLGAWLNRAIPGRLRERVAAHYHAMNYDWGGPQAFGQRANEQRGFDARQQFAAWLPVIQGRGNQDQEGQRELHRTIRRTVGSLTPAAAPFAMPGMMDYDMTGFDLGLGGNRPPTPKYEPPPEPSAGFTRNPEEHEVVVCPNCGDELAMGETELKQQIWVVKHCGHAYCGECAEHRLRTTNRKGKQRIINDNSLPQPFRKCVVEGCGKSTAKTMMVHVYLSS